MRSVTNHQLLESRTRWTKILSLVGLGALMAGIFLAGRSPLLSWIFLLIGLIAASIGANFSARYLREPKSEEILDRMLRGFDDRHVLYNFVLPIPHLFLTPIGPWILWVKKQPGEITYDGRKWRHKFSLGRLLGFFSEPSLGNPTKELQAEIEYFRERLSEAVGEEIPVYGVVVFTDPKARLRVTNPPLPVVAVERLKEWMRRELKSHPTLPPQTRKRLQEILDEWAS